MNRTVPQKCHAFTLTELLVCVGIIAVLASLMLASMKPLLHKGRTLTCLSNLRTISLAVLAYVQDHDATFPASLELGGASWMDSIVGYGVRSHYNTRDKVWYCPETDVNTPDRVSWGCPSYGANDLLFQKRYAADGSNSADPLIKLPQVNRPATTMMLWDNGNTGHPLWGHWQGIGTRWTDFAWPPVKDAAYWQGAPAPRHYGARGPQTSFGAVFCDGHAEEISVQDARVQSAADRLNLVTP